MRKISKPQFVEREEMKICVLEPLVIPAGFKRESDRCWNDSSWKKDGSVLDGLIEDHSYPGDVFIIFIAHDDLQKSHRLKLHGFTLIELLVVIAIILAILGIVLPVANNSYEKMRVHQTQADIAKLEVALEGYKSKYGDYPPASPASRVPVSALGEFMTFPTKRVIASVFYDPWNIPYRYSKPGTNHTNFVDMTSAGPDRQIDDTNWQTSLAGVNADNIDNWSQKR